MWDYERDELQEELQDPASSGLRRWLDGMIAGEGRCSIGSPSPFWTGSPPNLVTTGLVFRLLLLVVTSGPHPSHFPFVLAGTRQAQISSSSQEGAGRSHSPSRAVEGGHREEKEEGAPCPGA